MLSCYCCSVVIEKHDGKMSLDLIQGLQARSETRGYRVVLPKNGKLFRCRELVDRI